MSAEISTSGVNRRSLALGAAWAAPVIALSTSAPAFAVSGTTPTVAESPGCKAPGSSCAPIQKGYAFPFQLTNTDTIDIWIYTVTFVSTVPSNVYTDVFSGGQLIQTNSTGTVDTVAVLPLNIPPGGTLYFKYNGFASSSANLAYDANLSFTWGHTATAAGDTDHQPVNFTINIGASPPDCCK
ncbi:MAG: hypothetical protein V9E81_06940 [Marmoricola sp.]